MKILSTAIAIYLLTGLSFAQSSNYPYTVMSIHDGDTIKVASQGHQKMSIRLYGIDAPEVAPPVGTTTKELRDDFQPLADMSTNKLKSLIPVGSLVSLECNGKSYKRTVCVVKDYFYGVDINREMVVSGWAYASNYDGKKPYFEEQSQAQYEGVGLWNRGLPQLEKPWDYRARLRNTNRKPINIERLIK